jgi:hypothetical protein
MQGCNPSAELEAGADRGLGSMPLTVLLSVAIIAEERFTMTVILDLKPEVQAGLLSQAQASGMSLEAFLEQVLREKSHARSCGRKPRHLAQLRSFPPKNGGARSTTG